MYLRSIATIYIFNDDQVLLMHRVGSRLFKGEIWVGIGGHFEENELNDPYACAIREIMEETGISSIDIDNLTLKYITTRLADNEIRQQYIFFTTLKTKNIELISCDEGKLFWIPVSQLFERKMAFSNTHCLKHYLSTKNDNIIYHGAVSEQDGRLFVHFTALKEYSTDH